MSKTKFRKCPGFMGITSVLNEEQIPYRVVRGGKHFKVIFEVNGVELMKPFSFRGADPRAQRNVISDTRNMIRQTREKTQ